MENKNNNYEIKNNSGSIFKNENATGNQPTYRGRNAVNTLTEKEIYDLFILVQESKDTGNKEWDKSMESIYKKLQSKI